MAAADCRVATSFDSGKENNNKGMIEILLTLDDKKKIAHDMHQETYTIPMTMATESKTMLFPPLLSTSRTDNTPILAASNGGNDIECLPIQHGEKKKDLSATKDAAVHDSLPLPPNSTSNMPLDIGRTNKGVRRPVAIRPSAVDPTMSKPGLYFGPPTEEESSKSTHIEEGTDILSNLSTRMPSIPAPLASAPQLRIRPIHHARKESEKKLPSPLARRGAAERQYLQGQIKAELRERRKQRQHNEDRKMRGSISPKNIEGLKDKNITSSDADAQSIANKFKLGTFGRDGQKGIVNYLPKKTNKDSRGGFGAASPPSLLKKTFKRSVSAVLEDSGIAEDGNLLFYPSGEQIQYEEQKTTTTLHETVEEVESPGSDDGGNALDAESPAQLSPASSSDEELSPSLIGADMIWQLGEFNVILDEGSSTNQVSKKITLQPKMKYETPEDNVANCVTQPTQDFKSIEDNQPPKTVTLQTQHASAKATESIAEGDKHTPLKYESPSKAGFMQTSESFRMLSLNDDELLNRQRLGSVDRQMSVSPFEFSSPDFKTPDNSENTRTRKASFGIMPKLPELGMPDMVIDMNDYKKEEEEKPGSSTTITFETLVKEPLTEVAYKTPDNSSNKSVHRKSLADGHIPKMPIMNGRVEASDPKPANIPKEESLELGLSLDDSDKLSESNFNYTTPDHPGRTSRFNQEVHSIPKLPHFNNEVIAPESLFGKGEDSPPTPAAA